MKSSPAAIIVRLMLEIERQRAELDALRYPRPVKPFPLLSGDDIVRTLHPSWPQGRNRR